MHGPSPILPLELRDVSLAAGGKRVIKDLTCTFTAELACSVIIGPNGAGKSLFLKLCHGLIAPGTGQVRWGGGGDPGLTDRRQAMVFQRPVLLRRSVAANISFALRLQGLASAERHRRIAEALEKTGLKRLAEQPARLLSFGEQQRLALARAWALRPQLLLLDEATANLDPAATHLFEDIVREAAARGTRVIMTTHDLNQARRLADEVLFMHRGRLKEQAPAEAFFAGPRNDLAQAFLRGELLWWRKRSIYNGDDDRPQLE
ncbi:MAG: phosphate ABC transporter ATP-binding protein [Alphaproteobacteria bacterium]|jgi:tungstate transport system ATP-binding protein|nr:phosphate ABC transporter ATP-binding protein [Alphaproteobacteria bacterium]MDP6566084.1 phosphate ABC transporter ATP-binding protein [Alphaproteobacteria bacterium]MDP6812910.1 phosphate ABC transporter ATP-binding protein [Alphaproteobacteria bacterium]